MPSGNSLSSGMQMVLGLNLPVFPLTDTRTSPVCIPFKSLRREPSPFSPWAPEKFAGAFPCTLQHMLGADAQKCLGIFNVTPGFDQRTWDLCLPDHLLSESSVTESPSNKTVKWGGKTKVAKCCYWKNKII